MSQFDLHTGSARLKHAIVELQEKWQQTCDSWQDDVQRKFAETYLDPLGIEVKSALDAAARIRQLIGEAERKCSPDEVIE